MFESSVIVTRPQSPGRSRIVVLPVSIALHVAAISVAVLASTWSVEMPTQTPDQFQAFIVEEFVVPPPPRQYGRRVDPKPEQPPEPPRAEPRAPQEDAAPSVVPTEIVDMDGPRESDGTADTVGKGDPLGVPGGDPNGVADGIDGGVAMFDALPPQLDPVYVTGEIDPPVVVHRVEPEYPELMRRMGIEGHVIVQCIIDRNGALRNVKILSAPHQMLAESVQRAVGQWRFEPGSLNGRPLDVIFNLTVNFDLD